MTMTDSLRLDAPAKINLGLRIGPRTDRGYHEIRTVYQTISLSDRLVFRASPSGSDTLDVEGPVSVPVNSDNLILRTLERVRKAGYTVPPVSVTLRKEIPVEAGLGGGSTDAAATLNAVRELFDLGVPDEDLGRIAGKIGADVPFLLEGGTVLGTGRGDQLKALPSLEGQGLLCVPPYGISTDWAYREVQPRSKEKLPGILPSGTGNEGIETWEELDLTNDFEPLVSRTHELHPKLLGILTDLSSSSGLSGSGSALYALFDQSRDLSELRNDLSAEFDECRWYQFEFIPRENER